MKEEKQVLTFAK